MLHRSKIDKPYSNMDGSKTTGNSLIDCLVGSFIAHAVTLQI